MDQKWKNRQSDQTWERSLRAVRYALERRTNERNLSVRGAAGDGQTGEIKFACENRERNRDLTASSHPLWGGPGHHSRQS